MSTIDISILNPEATPGQPLGERGHRQLERIGQLPKAKRKLTLGMPKGRCSPSKVAKGCRA